MRALSRRAGALLRRLRGDLSGATAVEFGMIAVPFLAVILSIFEFGYVHMGSEILSSAVSQAARSMLTGATQATGAVNNATDFVNRYLCPANGKRLVPSNFDCTKLVVDVRTVTSFSNASTASDIYKTGTVFCPGKPGDYVVMRVVYPLPAIMPLNLFSPTMGAVRDVPNASGAYHILLAAALFREENFSSPYSAPNGC